MDHRTARLHSWEGPLPELGYYLKTSRGTMYVIIGIRHRSKPESKTIATLDLLKLSTSEIDDVPSDAIICDFKWSSPVRN